MKSLDKPTVAAYLDRVIFNELPFREQHNPKVVVLFSGGNGVGKSTLARYLQHEFKALVIENDAIRTVLLDYEPGLINDRERLGNVMWNYTTDLYPSLASRTPNGLVVRDAVVDWSFEKIIPMFQQAGYELFIVRFELSREKRIELLQARGGKQWISLENFIEMMDLHDMHAARFLSQYTPDVVLTDETVFQYQNVAKALTKKLQSINTQ